jgi:transposase-like protein
MSKRESPYPGHRFPPVLISHAVWLYTRFCLSFRDVEDLLAERGIEVSYETIRRWCLKFGPRYRRALKRREGRLGDTWHVDEVFIKIRGRQHCFLSLHAPVQNLFRYGRHLLRAANHRLFRRKAFDVWSQVTCA